MPLYDGWWLQTEYQRLALGYGPRFEDPHRPNTHWDFLLKEAYWLARDVGQVRSSSSSSSSSFKSSAVQQCQQQQQQQRVCRDLGERH
jgi:hypothetical protein